MPKAPSRPADKGRSEQMEAGKPKPETNGHTTDVTDLPEPHPTDDTPADPAVEMVEIDFRGETFTVPKYADDWRTVDLEALWRQDNVFDVIRACIGEQQWQQFSARFPKYRDFKEFRDLIGTTIKTECVGL